MATGITVDFAWDADGNVLPCIGGLDAYWPTVPVGPRSVPSCFSTSWLWGAAATNYEPGELKPDGTVSTGTRLGKSAGAATIYEPGELKPDGTVSTGTREDRRAAGATNYEPGELKPDGTVSSGTQEGKSAGAQAKGGAKGQNKRKVPCNFPLALGFATWHHEACSLHHASAVTRVQRGPATFSIKCPSTNGGCGVTSRVGDISNVKEYDTLEAAREALAQDRSACSKCAAAKAQASAGLS
ncbi:hypothetical protein TSOC_004481 [Tetrabaena socialis]|uniref:Uncharacterized protein n=1 Tax=Tetrabaena socialis TaxID=47790 RepID=A0A2J8A8Y9_9CHLO|nr:hypothetical protein TSOC_004481 [Tetrabaena socialis]|eukprot:PNH08965.1 hypothetical protein TSOC_004481 [Tetrabaena socialis]